MRHIINAIRCRARSFVALGLAAAALTATFAAHADDHQFSAKEPTSGGGTPEILVGFNPLPDPEGIQSDVDMSDSTRPVIRTSSPYDNDFALVLAPKEAEADLVEIYLPPGPCRIEAPVVVYSRDGVEGPFTLPPGPCRDGRLDFVAVFSNGSELEIRLDVSSSSGTFDPLSAVATSPGPPEFPAAIEIAFSIAGASGGANAAVAVQLLDKGAPVPLMN